jgi:hypothetical protein
LQEVVAVVDIIILEAVVLEDIEILIILKVQVEEEVLKVLYHLLLEKLIQ